MPSPGYPLGRTHGWSLPAAYRRIASPRVFWAAIALLVTLEYLLFRQFAVREVLPTYPIAHDQTAYLTRAFAAYESVLDDGLVRGILGALLEPTARSPLLSAAVIPMFIAFGASRLTALSFNFAVFALSQIVVAVTAWRITGRRALSCLALGLLLASGTFRLLIGGVYDFRLESIAASLYAAFVGVVLATSGFRSRTMSVAAGAMAALVIGFRLLSVAYVGGVFLLVLMALSARGRSTADARRRVRGALVASGVAAVLALPALARNASALWSIYVVYQRRSPDALARRRVAGLTSVARDLAYYPWSLISDHLGASALFLAAVAVCAVAIARMADRAPPRRAPVGWWEIVVALVSGAVPLVVLTANPTKLHTLAGILVGPFVWVVVLAVAAIGGVAPEIRGGRRTSAAVALCGVVTLVGGLAVHANASVRRSALTADRHGANETMRMLRAASDHTAKLTAVRIAIFGDRIYDFIPAIGTTYYERHRSVLGVEYLVQGIWEVPIARALEFLDDADIAFISADPSAHVRYPYDHSMSAHWATLRERAAQNLELSGTYQASGGAVELYVRPAPLRSGRPPAAGSRRTG